MLNQEMEERLSSLTRVVNSLRSKLDQIPLPFKFMYRPPGRDFHLDLVAYLNEIEERLQKLEKDASTDI
jgi:hypothetical protein